MPEGCFPAARRFFSFLFFLIAFTSCYADPIRAQVALVEDNGPHHTLGPTAAMGAVIWSHGRSVLVEDSKSPTPGYIETFRMQGWDAFRFNRTRDIDFLRKGSLSLASFAGMLKARGYRKVVLAGQSYGAFMSLMAADISPDVDTVVAVAPAAFGPVRDNPKMGALNASRLYPVLERVRRARIMLFYFKDDMFDPGGRGARSDQILSTHQNNHLVVDQPIGLETHWAGGTPEFTARFGPCIVAFARDGNGAAPVCQVTARSELRSADSDVPPRPSRSKSMATAPLSGGSAPR
jgi:pimeloyl-ACP methyl ester carboxylesterase